MTSDASYVTNPYAFSGPAQTSPPPYPPPPVPSAQSPLPGTPLQPPGLSVSTPVQRSPPSSADFLMPPLNFVPAATAYFSQATVLARRLLPGSDPLRLSVAFESCAFSWECGKDFALAKQKAKETIREVYSAPEGMEDAEFEDAATLVQAIAAIAKRSDSTQASSRSPTPLVKITPRSSPSSSPTQRAVSKPASLRSPKPRRPRSRQSQKSIRTSSRKREKMPATNVTETKSSTPEKPVEQVKNLKGLSEKPPVPPPKEKLPDIPTKEKLPDLPPPPPKEKLPDLPRGPSPASRKSPRRPRANSRTSQTSKASSTGATTMSEKERKRRIVEQAEERIRRRNNAQGQSASASGRR
ncbi:Hypothetical protein D9617_1g087700 [Elsinoe fawcettii]|nr:Hypothetical protein D9617_1g087700 [Elsinoe fawcettii]